MSQERYHNLVKKAQQKGSEESYYSWLRRFPSCLTGVYSEFVHGAGRCEVAHVRHVSMGAGVSEKPPYWAVPLTHEEHSHTHKRGDSSIMSAEKWDQKAARYLVNWINGVQPPDTEDQKKEINIVATEANEVTALCLFAKKHFVHSDTPIRFTAKEYNPKRSLAQNRAQWGVIYSQVLEFYEKNPMALARDALESIQFGVNQDFIHEMFKRLFLKGKSTARLTTKNHNEYIESIRDKMLHDHQFIVNEPTNKIEGFEYV